MKINGVFEGGGVKGIALAGAVSAAQDKGYEFHEVAGTSSGSIVAAFLAAGYTGEEMKRMILSMPFRSFLQRSPIFNTRILGPASRLLIKKGLYSGEALEHWVYRILLSKGIRTFGDLRPNQLRIIASDITQGKILVLPDDIAQYGIDPRMFPVAKAVRMSTSIPYFFDPVMIRIQRKSSAGAEPFSKQFYYIVDGGVLSNYPLWVFDREAFVDRTPVIGFRLVGKSEFHHHNIRGPITMFEALFSTMLSAHDAMYIEKQDRFRTVKIPTLGVQNTDFNLSKEKSLELYEAGYNAAAQYFQTWSMQTYEQDYEKFVLRKR
ncbi:patatin-like phospholipase family protein [Paenibacillus hexagrammi]|uniref:Patatin-like phospholipase family protein n=1 Tax=Paenibacillus hexagrammi TaxID=2908839 RepID=A0ABY3SBI5_9BACL|nr:patatin-like phospholipase family protein [Paenibacillus sp. YPD9-1]UJF31271.1 patatin-like phospholipase family protein [Paenibacillus sp. YPD9-1]